MRKSIILSVVLAIAMSAQAYDFMAANEDGVELAYRIINEDIAQVAVVPTVNTNIWDSTVVNYPNITDATVRIPDAVTYNGKSYVVSDINRAAFANTSAIKKIIIPKTIINIGIFALNNNCGIEEIIVAEENPAYKSVDGVLYTKDMGRLCCYPSHKKDSVYIIPEGPRIVGTLAFLSLCYLRDITFPLSLKEMEYLAMIDTAINRAVFQDSVRVFNVNSITLLYANEMVLGNRVDTFIQDYLALEKPQSLTCRTVTPPYFPYLQSAEGTHLAESELRVPMQSVAAYQQAEGWKLFGKIVSIEPSVVSGLNDVQVSWVQNFSATGYVWTLYLDEEHTQRYMTLTFDANGHLTNIDLAGNNAPARMPALYEEDDEPTRFAEYYTFTITGLQSGTTYYFTRQSLNGTDVIDEENGTFATQQSTEGIEHAHSKSLPSKIISNGSVLVKQGDKTYTITGAEVK